MKGRAVHRLVGASGEGNLLLVDLEAGRAFVLEAVDQDRVGLKQRPVPRDVCVVVGEAEGQAGDEGEGEGAARAARRRR